jgi:uncharacterized flavoprotein (TIGR03862 family)
MQPRHGSPSAVVVGAGPAGLAAAEVMAAAGLGVSVHDWTPSPARKFLMAGRGGLNLTHSEPIEAFLARYGASRARLEPAIRAFSPEALRAWCRGLGVETFVGSSGRVFPVAMKASPLLRAWLQRLAGLGVRLVTRSRWTGWDDEALLFEEPEGVRRLRPRVAVFALGGASWPRLGSDGGWAKAFAARGVDLAPFAPANCGFRVDWSEGFRSAHAGQPLKPLGLSFGGRSVRGEAVIVRTGIEGGGVYALSAQLRDAIAREGAAELDLDLAPNATLDALTRRLQGAGPASISNRLRRAGLSKTAAALVREDVRGPSPPGEPEALAARIKSVRLRLTAPFGLERAISSAGGVCWGAVNPDFSLKAAPGVFVCGEMLDWEAPTGGYLLQACFATGRAAGVAAANQSCSTVSRFVS